jgi:hypothetical protein
MSPYIMTSVSSLAPSILRELLLLVADHVTGCIISLRIWLSVSQIQTILVGSGESTVVRAFIKELNTCKATINRALNCFTLRRRPFSP